MADCNIQDQDNTASSPITSPKQSGENADGQPLSATSGSPSHKGEQPPENNNNTGDAAFKKEKEKEREDRIRAVKEKQKIDRQRKMDELFESQRLAQEHREKQQELRRKKIDDLRRREDERRAAVDERRRRREEMERAKHEAILAKTSERLARYEAWKASGKGKGGVQGPFGFGSRTPRDICQRLGRGRRATSQSAIYRRSPNDSDSDSYYRPQRRAISACSTVRRHCCVDISSSNGLVPGYVPPSKRLSASTSVLYHKKTPDLGSPSHLNTSMRNLPSAHALGTIPENRSFLASRGSTPHRPRSTVGLHTPKDSDNTNTQQRPTRKPRPASIAGNLPGFVSLSPPTSAAASRSKSSDRLHKEKPRPRPQSTGPERKKREIDERSDIQKSQTPSAKFNLRRTTVSTIERLSVPKHSRDKPDSAKNGDNTPQKETPRRKSKGRSRKSKTPGKENLDDNASTGTADSTPSKDSLSVSKPTRNSTPKQSKAEAPNNAQSNHPEGDHDNINKPPSVEEEYKAKLAENRRQAREKAEKEAEGERLKIEEERIKEEERLRLEEEEEQRMEEEAMRLATDARDAEEERLRKAIEAEELRKKEEAERIEQDKLAKEEADKKAKEEAERLEKEKQEKAKKEEEERLERKKRLESIMKRVKTDPQLEATKTPTDSPAKSNQGSPVKSSSSQELSTEDKTDEEGGLSPEDSTAEEETAEEDGRPKFSSPLLKQLMDKRGDDSPGDDRPKFKSPLLQNLLGKNKAVSRSSSEKNLSEMKSDTEDSEEPRPSSAQRKLISVENYNDYNGKNENGSDVEEKPTNGEVHQEQITSEEKESDTTDEHPSGEENSPSSETGETTLMNVAADEEQTDVHCNGLGTHVINDDNSQALIDSSISMKTDDTGRSLTSSYRDDDLVTSTETPGELASQEVSGEGRFEEIIDLSVSNKNLNFEETTTSSIRTTTTDDLLNFNSLPGLDPQGDGLPKAPFIAFEDNAVNRQDVTPDLLS